MFSLSLPICLAVISFFWTLPPLCLSSRTPEDFRASFLRSHRYERSRLPAEGYTRPAGSCSPTQHLPTMVRAFSSRSARPDFPSDFNPVRLLTPYQQENLQTRSGFLPGLTSKFQRQVTGTSTSSEKDKMQGPKPSPLFRKLPNGVRNHLIAMIGEFVGTFM